MGWIKEKVKTISSRSGKTGMPYNPNLELDFDQSKLKEIYLAGGCFWGLEAYMARIYGVYDTVSGYANGNTENPSYEDLIYRGSGHAETVEVKYDPNRVDIETLLIYYFRVIDPTSLNGQGNDRGVQYRTGIYYTDENDLPMIKNKLQEISKEYDQPIAVEVEPLKHFYKAEDYHQDYLENNPNGYCHIDLYSVVDPVIKADWYEKPADEILKDKLTEAQYEVTQNNHTEPSFSNEYHDTFEKGIYVDVVTGEPLFLSMDKFESACGWPSFSKPIIAEVICFVKDSTFNMIRTEVRSRVGDSHLGHVFEDGPKNQGGLRFCINSASIRLVDYDVMEKEGYGYLMYLFN